MTIKPLPCREIKRKLEASGFQERQGRGSHRKFVKFTREGVLTALVPFHSEVAIGTLRSILRQAALSPEKFEAL